jgi:hypothetical protein
VANRIINLLARTPIAKKCSAILLTPHSVLAPVQKRSLRPTRGLVRAR